MAYFKFAFNSRWTPDQQSRIGFYVEDEGFFEGEMRQQWAPFYCKSALGHIGETCVFCGYKEG